MRPLELVIQGFRSFGDRVEIDWRGRRLVGIVGPIGSGKTSILDAVVFALYGKTPVFQAENKTLIRHGAPSARVELAFEVEEESWRVIRVIRRKGASQHALQRLDAAGVGATVSEKEREVNQRIEELLGLDFQTFNRSVLLAQNRFAEFLHASPGERDRVLKGVFGFERLDAMQAAARQRRDDAELEARELKGRLGSLQEDAERLRHARRALKSSTARVDRLEEAAARAADLAEQAVDADRLAADHRRRLERLRELEEGLPPLDEATVLLDEANRAAEKRQRQEEEHASFAAELVRAEQQHAAVLAEVGSDGDLARAESRLEALRRAERELGRRRDRERTLERRFREEEDALAAARAALKAASQTERLSGLKAQQTATALRRAEENAARDAAAAGGHDALDGARRDLQRLAQARLDLAREKEAERRQRQRLAAAVADAEKAAERAATAARGEGAAEEEHRGAEAAVRAAEDGVRKAERAEMAVVLAADLVAGEPCPVCAQPVDENHLHEKHRHRKPPSAALDDARRRLETARSERDAAAAGLRQKASAAAAAREAVASAEKRRTEDEEALASASAAVEERARGCRSLEDALDALPGDGPPEARLEALEETLATAAAAVAAAAQEHQGAEDERREAHHALALAREQESSAVRRHQEVERELAEARWDVKATEEEQKDANVKVREAVGDAGPGAEKKVQEDRERLAAVAKTLDWSRERERSAQAALNETRKAAEDASRRQEGLKNRLAAAAGQLGELLGEGSRTLDNGDVREEPGEMARRLAEDVRRARLDAEAQVSAAENDAATARRETAALLASLDVPPDEAARGFDRVLTEAQKAQARDAATVAELEGRLGRAQEMEEALRDSEKRRDLYRQLADDLTASKFLRYLLEQERAALSVLGSDRFERLSEGRYRFTHDGTFQVIDLNHAGAERRPETLSGGETFLASLALALALAEKVSASGGRLDAFFLDEGFGSLDPEHLDLALQGIERLVTESSNRLVTVVSHVPEMRERLEDLIELDKDPLTGQSVVCRGARKTV